MAFLKFKLISRKNYLVKYFSDMTCEITQPIIAYIEYFVITLTTKDEQGAEITSWFFPPLNKSSWFHMNLFAL